MLNDDSINESIYRIEYYLREILTWLKLSNLDRIREILLKELNTSERMMIYDLTDGKRTQQEISKMTNVSRRMISYYWQKWYGLGILTQDSKREGRMKKLLSLDEVGISSPNIQQKEEPQLTFKSEDLVNILKNEKIFPNTIEIENFARSVLLTPENENLIAGNKSREELANIIFDVFENSNHLKQAMFMQALERLASEKKDTQFKKFFDFWQEHIRG